MLSGLSSPPASAAASAEAGIGHVLDDDASFEIIFKIQETCNLNCSYCYMYNMGNELFRNVPTAAPLDVCIAVADMIVGEFRRRSPRYAHLVLHGGEPMLMPPRRFRERMAAIHGRLTSLLSPEEMQRVHFTMQTNATLVTPEWVSLLSEFNIAVGVTIDGPREFHDQVRVDRNGAGSYDRVLEGLKLLKAAEAAGQIKEVGCLTVINPVIGGTRAYRHIVDEMGFQNFDFLLPFQDWDTYDPPHAEAVGRFLADAFRTWTERNDGVGVRIFERAIKEMLRPEQNRMGRTLGIKLKHHFIVVESDGSIMPDETVRTRVKDRFSDANVRNCSYEAAFLHPAYLELTDAHLSLPAECEECALVNCCHGGRALARVGSRYSSANGFKNRTAHCESLIPLYAEVYRYLAGSSDLELRQRLEATVSVSDRADPLGCA